MCFDRDGVWFTDARGLQWRFDPEIWGSALGAATGSVHESAEIDAVCQHLTDSSVVVDVGANIGAFALPVIEATGASVIAIEPVTSTFALLKANVHRNGADHLVTAVHSALGEGTGEVIVTTDAQSANYVMTDRTIARDGEEQISITTLDQLLALESRIDLIKVDVEGLELSVLRGARETLARHYPIVLLEIEARWTTRYGYEPDDIFDFMAAAGYTYRTIGVERLPSPANGPADLRLGNNVLFTPRGVGEGRQPQSTAAR